MGRWVGLSGALTCIRRPIVAPDICCLMRVGGHHLIVVLIRAVDTYLGSPIRSNAQELSGLGLVLTPSFSCSHPSPRHQEAKGKGTTSPIKSITLL